MVKITEVNGGRFVCDECGITWVGTFHGPKKDITCINCGEYLFPELRKEDDDGI